MKKLSHIYLHKPFMMPVLRQEIKRTLDQKTYPGIEMHLDDFGNVHVKFQDVEFGFDKGNIQCWVAEKETEKKKVEKRV
jgi:hypothetical protein